MCCLCDAGPAFLVRWRVHFAGCFNHRIAQTRICSPEPRWTGSPTARPFRISTRAAGTNIAMLILHYTNMTDAEAALARLCDPPQVSAHYLIARDAGFSLWWTRGPCLARRRVGGRVYATLTRLSALNWTIRVTMSAGNDRLSAGANGGTG